MDVVLVPGMWLDASAWEAVAEPLHAAGHPAIPLSLPGMRREGGGPRPSDVSLSDLVSAIVTAMGSAQGPQVALVAHSASCGLAYAAVDAAPAKVFRAFYIGGFPTGAGQPMVDGFEAPDGQVPLPDWSEFSPEDLRDLDETALRRFRERAVPAPGCLTTERQRLADPRRYDVPVTMVATEFTAAMLEEWVEQGLEPVSELPKINDVEYVDLPTGHWPQFSKPTQLARIILDRLPDAAG